MLQHQAGVGNLAAHPQLMKFPLQLQGVRVGDGVGTEAQPGNHQVTIHNPHPMPPVRRPGTSRARAPATGNSHIGGKSA